MKPTEVLHSIRRLPAFCGRTAMQLAQDPTPSTCQCNRTPAFESPARFAGKNRQSTTGRVTGFNEQARTLRGDISSDEGIAVGARRVAEPPSTAYVTRGIEAARAVRLWSAAFCRQRRFYQRSLGSNVTKLMLEPLAPDTVQLAGTAIFGFRAGVTAGLKSLEASVQLVAQ